MFRFRTLLATSFAPLLAVTCLTSCVSRRDDDKPPKFRNYPLATSTAAVGPSFELRDNEPFQLAFGRGSGWGGMNTEVVDDTGLVTLRRKTKEGNWQVGSLQITPRDVQQLRDTIRREGLLAMDAAYHGKVDEDDEEKDGWQWEFLIAQGDISRRTYFHNHFPRGIMRFASVMDSVLRRNGLGSVKWSAAY